MRLKRKIIKCINCGKDTKNPKFCSLSCAAKVNNKGKKHSIETRRKLSISQGGNGTLSERGKCINCGKEKFGEKYCSLKCKIEYEYKNKVSKWMSSELSGTGNTGGPEYYIKRYLLEKQNNSCSKCGWNEINPYTKTSPLHLHHNDGIYNHNRPENVELICPNCHSLTKNFGSRNKGNGKPWMREYFKEYSKASTSYKKYMKENELKT